MAFTTKYKGLEVQCDSIADLDALAAQFARSQSVQARGPELNTGSPRPSQHASMAPVTPASIGTPLTISALVNQLNQNQRRLLNLLVSVYPGSMSDVQLREEFGLNSNKSLAGLLAGLSKTTIRAGRKADLIDTAMTRSGKMRGYSYTVNPAAIDDLRAQFHPKEETPNG